jgi:hypothetical protein
MREEGGAGSLKPGSSSDPRGLCGGVKVVPEPWGELCHGLSVLRAHAVTYSLKVYIQKDIKGAPRTCEYFCQQKGDSPQLVSPNGDTSLLISLLFFLKTSSIHSLSIPILSPCLPKRGLRISVCLVHPICMHGGVEQEKTHLLLHCIEEETEAQRG